VIEETNPLREQGIVSEPTDLLPQAAPPSGKAPIDRVAEGIKYVSLVSGLVGVIVSLAVWAAGKRQAHLVVWLRNDGIIYPAALSSNHSLPLTFAGIPAETASVVTVDISNYGKRVIGNEESSWELALRFPNAAIVAPLGALKTRPAPIVAFVRRQANPKEVAVGMGLLEPGAHIVVSVMLINDRNAGHSRAEAKATLAGLPVEVTRASPEERLQQRLWIPVTLGIFGAALVVGLRERSSKLAAGTSNKAPSVGTQLGLALILGFLGGYTVSFAMAWLILRIIE
jgi:hypothetical protein